MRAKARITIATTLALTLAALAPSAASAAFGISEWDGRLASEEGVLQAGGHPADIVTKLAFNSHVDNSAGFPALLPDAGVRNVVADLPAGFIGAPTATPACRGAAELNPGGATIARCPVDSIVGSIKVIYGGDGVQSEFSSWITPIYNMKAPVGQPAQFGFNVAGFAQLLTANVRSDGDFGVRLQGRNIGQGLSVISVETTFWGVPGDPSHDALRCRATGSIGGPCFPFLPGNPDFGTNPFSGGTVRPLLTNPTACSPAGEGLDFGLAAESWEQPANRDQASFITRLDPPDEATLLGTSGCERVPFQPDITIQPTTDEAETPSGLEVALTVPPDGLYNPKGISQSSLKDAKVTLPEGMTINPSYADGVTYCSASQVGLTTGNSPDIHFNTEPAHCPDASQAAEVRIDTPLLDQPLLGAAYVAQQDDPKHPGVENPFDSTLALYIVVEGSGILIKLAGEVSPDQKTGQVVTTFLNNPQVPFERFALKFKGGQRAPLSTPPICGIHSATAELAPWARPSDPVTVSDSFQITRGPHGGPCPNGKTPPFKPGLLAGMLNNAAGSYSPFHLRLTREDGEQEFTRFSIKLPPGLVGKLAGVPFCPDAAIAASKNKSGAEELAAPSCPQASQVGRTEVGVGVGSLLVYVPGKVYLAGPYNGSALSVVAITAAKAGPFDLGTVAIRQALKVNPETAEVFIDSVVSDPIPHIIKGIPVHARDIRVYVDRPDFTLNPTSCKRTSIASTVVGSGLDFGSAADDNPFTVTSPFQAADCASLGFKPKLSLSLLGGTRRGDNPRFKAVLTARKGDANIGRAQVTLPHSEFLEQSHIRTICTRVQFAQGSFPGEKCPPGSIYGYAKAITPLLDEPLQGPVFLRSSDHPLPDLVAALHSGKIDINVVGRIDSVGEGQIRNTFEAVPDAPVTKFTLTMQGGKKGLLVNSTNLCRSTHRTLVAFDGQNGKVHDFRPVLKATGCKKQKKKK